MNHLNETTGILFYPQTWSVVYWHSNFRWDYSMTRYHYINGELIAITAEEETARDLEEAAALTYTAATPYIKNRQKFGTITYPELSDTVRSIIS